MTTDPRAALRDLVNALERHLEACASKHGEDDPVVASLADAVADAFDVYDEALMEAYGEVTPLEVFDDPDDELDDHDDEDGDSQFYSGLDGDYDDE